MMSRNSLGPGCSYKLQFDFGETRIRYENSPGKRLSPRQTFELIKKTVAELERTFFKPDTTCNLDFVPPEKGARPMQHTPPRSRRKGPKA